MRSAPSIPDRSRAPQNRPNETAEDTAGAEATTPIYRQRDSARCLCKFKCRVAELLKRWFASLELTDLH